MKEVKTVSARKKMTALVLAMVMILAAGMLGTSCEKSDETKATASAVKTATAAKTTVKATAAATTVKTTTAAAAATTASVATGAAEVTEATGTSTEVVINPDDGLASEFVKDVEVVLEDSGYTFDLGGKTLVMSCWSPNYWPSNSGTSQLVAVYQNILAAEKKYNFKMSYVLAVNYNQYLADVTSQTLAGVKFADIFICQTGFTYPTYIKQGFIIPLDEYIDYESPVIKANSFVYNGTRYRDKHYAFSHNFEVTYARVMYNKDILDREGQAEPLDLVEADQWNWGTFRDIAMNTTRDTDGNGVIDQWGIIVWNNLEYAQHMMYSNGAKIVDYIDGDYRLSLNTPRSIKALQFASDLTFVDKVVKFEGGQPVPSYINGRAAMYINANYYNTSHLVQYNMSASKVVPLPKGPDVDVYQNIALVNCWAILSTVPNPKEIATIVKDACVIWDESLKPSPVYQAIIDKLPGDWEWTNPVRTVSTEREYRLSIKALFPLFQVDFTNGFGTLRSRFNTVLATPIFTGKMSVMQAIDSASGELNDIINSLK